VSGGMKQRGEGKTHSAQQAGVWLLGLEEDAKLLTHMAVG